MLFFSPRCRYYGIRVKILFYSYFVVYIFDNSLQQDYFGTFIIFYSIFFLELSIELYMWFVPAEKNIILLL